MKQTITSKNTPTKSSFDDVARDVRLDNQYAVEDSDAYVNALNFIYGAKTGVRKAKLVEYSPKREEFFEMVEAGKLPDIVLKWDIDGIGLRKSRVYLDKRLEKWCNACDRRTAYGARKLARAQGMAEPDLYHRIETLAGMPEVLINYDYFGSDMQYPAVSLWLPSDFKEARDNRRNYISA